jgi:thioredoxin 1
MAQVEHVDENAFETTISKGKVLVDFSAQWCGPCRMMEPVLDQLAQDLEGTAVIAKIDVEEAQSLALKYDVTTVPTFILFKNGEMQGKIVGVKDLKALKAFIETA